MAGQQRLAALSAHLLPGAPLAAPAPASAAVQDSHMRTNVFANTVIMPSIGLGCAFVGSEDGRRSQWDVATEMVEAAVSAGYLHFDTAQRYGTEAPIGAVLKSHFQAGTLRREEVFITTKTSNPRPGSGGMPAGGGWVPDGRGYMVDEAADAYAGLTAELEGCLETLQVRAVACCCCRRCCCCCCCCDAGSVSSQCCMATPVGLPRRYLNTFGACG